MAQQGSALLTHPATDHAYFREALTCDEVPSALDHLRRWAAGRSPVYAPGLPPTLLVISPGLETDALWRAWRSLQGHNFFPVLQAKTLPKDRPPLGWVWSAQEAVTEVRTKLHLSAEAGHDWLVQVGQRADIA